MTVTEREYMRRINRVMDFIEANIDRPLPLDRLADVALFSKFHFHRVFFAHVGETPGQFIQRLRIEKAARLLLSNRERPVTEVAFDCGFSDSAAFARAFRAAFGVSASEFRRRRKTPAGTMSDRNLSTVAGKHGKAAGDVPRYGDGIFDTGRRIDMPRLTMEPIPAEAVSVVDQGELTLAYVRHTGPYFGDEQLFQRLFGTLYRWAAPRNLVTRGVTEEIIIYHDDPETVAPEKLRVSCCISIPAGTETSGEVGSMTLPAGRYAQARFRLDATQFAGAWNWVFGVWLPQSGYQPDDKL
ncbi:MAG: AraC family transcriptional regulator, partial [Spirochaetaceae bacterium]